MKRRHKRFVFIIASLAALGLAIFLILRALGANIAYSFTPTEVAAKTAPVNKKFRIGGLVQQGTLKAEQDGLTLHFVVTDTINSVPVVYRGIRPDLFKEGGGCVAEGRLNSNGVFYADRLLAKHDENYMSPEEARALTEAKQIDKIKQAADKTLSK